jgi:hypothetical protein
MTLACAPACPQIVGSERSLIEILVEGKIVQPLTGKTDLLNALGYISVMSQITIAGLEAFQKHEWRQFDALVGECACHQRAARIKDLADLFLSNKSWQQEITNEVQQAKTILSRLPHIKQQIEQSMHSGRDFKAKYGQSITPLKFCEEWNLQQTISERVRFVVECYLLTQTKKLIARENCFHQLSDVTEVDHLARFNCHLDGHTGDRNVQLIGKKKLKDLVQVLQRDLGNLSIGYLQREVQLLPSSPINELARQVIEREIRKDEFDRPCLPCFHALESLMQRVVTKNQSILIDIARWTTKGKKIDHIKILYLGQREMETLIKTAALGGNLPVFVIGGNSIREDQETLTAADYMKLFDAHPLGEILSTNWAQHAQYPGEMDKKIPPPADSRRNLLAKRAEMIGCSAANMSLFVVNHILCDRLDAALTNQEFL